MIETRIVADSTNPRGQRIITFVCTYPRFIHSEVMTHRVFSRNAPSSRAIPVEKMISRIEETPAEPLVWGQNQKGMQADKVLGLETSEQARQVWLQAASNAVFKSRELLSLGVHKQIANRLLEPFAHMTTLITATQWGNFFNLRAHKDAQPEFQELAFQMLDCYKASTPDEIGWGQWHLPFADKYINEGLDHVQLLKIATARAARISYLNFEGDIDHQKDFELHDNLLKQGHMSPFEHAAFASPEPDPRVDYFHYKGSWYPIKRYRSNFFGWIPYRKLIPNENREVFNPEQLTTERKLYESI